MCQAQPSLRVPRELLCSLWLLNSTVARRGPEEQRRQSRALLLPPHHIHQDSPCNSRTQSTREQMGVTMRVQVKQSMRLLLASSKFIVSVLQLTSALLGPCLFKIYEWYPLRLALLQLFLPQSELGSIRARTGQTS